MPPVYHLGPSGGTRKTSPDPFSATRDASAEGSIVGSLDDELALLLDEFGASRVLFANVTFGELPAGFTGTAAIGREVFGDTNRLYLTGIAAHGGAISAVPEPGTFVLLVLGLLAIGPVARRQRR